MSTPSRRARALPAVPNLEQQRKLARELLDAVRAHNPEALTRIRARHPRFAAGQTAEPDPAALSLHDAQLVLAREYGFPSWPKLKVHIEAIVASRRTHLLERDLEYYDDRAHGLLAVLADGALSTVEQVREWHPEYAGVPDPTIRAAAAAGTFTLDDARLVYAREHGFATWDRLAEHLQRLQAGKVTEPFVELLEAGKNADWKKVTAILESRPELVRARGTNGTSLLSLACGMLPCPGQRVTGVAVTALELVAVGGKHPPLPSRHSFPEIVENGTAGRVTIASTNSCAAMARFSATGITTSRSTLAATAEERGCPKRGNGYCQRHVDRVVQNHDSAAEDSHHGRQP